MGNTVDRIKISLLLTPANDHSQHPITAWILSAMNNDFPPGYNLIKGHNNSISWLSSQKLLHLSSYVYSFPFGHKYFENNVMENHMA